MTLDTFIPISTQMNRELYYTTSHEWIDFRSIEAFVGISNARLKGVKKIKKIEFVRLYGFKRKGEVFANIQLDNQRIEARMPVDGSIIAVNNAVSLAGRDILLSQPETEGWLVKILVSQPCPKKGLIPLEQYNPVL